MVHLVHLLPLTKMVVNGKPEPRLQVDDTVVSVYSPDSHGLRNLAFLQQNSRNSPRLGAGLMELFLWDQKVHALSGFCI